MKKWYIPDQELTEALKAFLDLNRDAKVKVIGIRSGLSKLISLDLVKKGKRCRQVLEMDRSTSPGSRFQYHKSRNQFLNKTVSGMNALIMEIIASLQKPPQLGAEDKF